MKKLHSENKYQDNFCVLQLMKRTYIDEDGEFEDDGRSDQDSSCCDTARLANRAQEETRKANKARETLKPNEAK